MKAWASTLLLLLAWSRAALAEGAPTLPEIDLFPALSGTGTVAAPLPPPPPPVVRPPPPAPQYYGYQTILVRAAGGATIAMGVAIANDAEGAGAGLSIAGVAAFVIGPVVVHALHGQPRNAVLSIGLNLLITSVGVGAGIGLGSDSSEGAVLGGVVGVGLAQVTMLILDATWLGYEDEPREPEVAVVPALLRDPEGAPLAGLVMAF